MAELDQSSTPPNTRVPEVGQVVRVFGADGELIEDLIIEEVHPDEIRKIGNGVEIVLRRFTLGQARSGIEEGPDLGEGGVVIGG